ncbi:MAG: DUF454 domain-containing protein [Candidatus Hydrogenedens sp.]|nr:DUF454 domain-containing protein [Candidatus Hydrogenedens sp.]
MSWLAKSILLAVGALSVALGVLGMFLPLLPTTPLLLLAAFCFARSSERAHRWLLHNRWFGEYLRNYHERRGITLRHKVVTLSTLWVMIGVSALFLVPLWWVKLLLLAIAAGVTVYLLRLNTLRPEEASRRDK